MQNVPIVAMEVRRLDIALQIGAVESIVEVSGAASMIETETARVSDTKSELQLKSLPLNTRSLSAFLSLTPTVIFATGDRATIRFAGSRNNQENQTLDGISYNNLYDGTRIGPLQGFIESFQEVRVDAANNTAEFGAVGQVTVISKSGTNTLHGSLFDYYGSTAMAARNPFSSTKGSFVTHSPGGSVGGPVYVPRIYDGRNKTFFFFSYEAMRGSRINELLNPTVPIAPWREGDFSGLLPGTVVRDPSTAQPFPGNRIPADRISEVARKLQDRFYPLPNFGNTAVFGNQNYRELVSRNYDPNTYWSTRIDHRFSDRAFVFGRLTMNHSENSRFEGNLPTIGQRWQIRDTNSLSLSYTQTITPNLLNELRGGFSFNDNPRYGPVMGKQLAEELGLQGLMPDLPDIQGIFKLSFTGMGITRLAQQDWKIPGFKNFPAQFQDHLSWFRGKHTIRAGTAISRVYFADGQAPANLFGSATFSNRFTGHPYADFLLGIPTTVARASAPFVVERLRWGYDFFATDEWKVTPRLTLSLGARYELHPGWIETNGRQGMFDIGSGKIVVPDGSLGLVSPLLPRSYVDVVEASSVGLPSKTLIRTDTNNIAPRIGLAWRPFGNDTVLRAGYGIFYDVGPARIRDTSAFALDEPAFTNAANNPTVIFPRVFPAASTGGPASINIPAAWNPDLKTPYSQQYNFTVEHQRWSTAFRASFIGTNTRKAEYGYDINQPVPDSRPYIDKPRPFPNYPRTTYLTNGAAHDYRSLTLEAERRFSKGLLFQSSWVWARDIGDLEREFTPENAYDRRRERGVWDDIPTHRFNLNSVYQLPFGKGRTLLSDGHPVVDAVFGGWEISGVFTAQTGQFLTPLWTGPDPVGIVPTSSRTPAQITIRPNILRDPNLPPDERTVGRWFDVSAFGPPSPGQFGTSSRGVIVGPGLNLLHAGIAKQFGLGERVRLRTELTATNALNHPNWSNPDLNISNGSTVGTISSVGGISENDQTGMRLLRVGIRLEW